jgi:hypothetical protein
MAFGGDAGFFITDANGNPITAADGKPISKIEVLTENLSFQSVTGMVHIWVEKCRFIKR